MAPVMLDSAITADCGHFPRGSLLRRIHRERLVGCLYGQRALCIGAAHPLNYVVTAIGASYVPQVARDLQTAPVVPPGAFPNGQGTGEQYGSEIPGWYISLSGQESATTLAAWTAAQEQRKREAEEAEEAGDPCTSTFVQGEYSFLGKQIMAAWADVEWCYTAHKVKSAKMKYQKYRIKNKWYEPEWQDFVEWKEEARWLSDWNPTEDREERVYFIERTAVFKGKLTEIPLPSEWEGSVLPNNRYYIALRFELRPNGYATAWASYWNEFGFEGPE